LAGGRAGGNTRPVAKALVKSKVFFSEEKKQKTFVCLARRCTQRRAQVAKVFWFFFSKKNFLLK
jgi:hypothetical protein